MKSTLLIAAILLTVNSAAGLEYVTIRHENQLLELTGEAVIEAEDGGLLLRDRESVLWAIPVEEIVSRSTDDAPFRPLSREELAAGLEAEFPGFRIHHTANYLIAYNTSPAYARWCGSLYERLYRAFRNYWERRGFQLQDPDTPLIALVFDTQANYRRYAQAELGSAVANVVGYYSLRTNRVTMFDLTGTQMQTQSSRRANSLAEINRLLMQPGAELMVATIVHEATHQLAYNCGFHTRLADVPLWISEGLAVYFETPDLRSSQGWSTIGGINPHRAERLNRYLGQRPADSLETLISSDERFRQPQTALDAYAEAWGLNYFLIRRYPAEFLRYLQLIAQKPPLIFDTPEQRLATFQQVFGQDLTKLDAEFRAYLTGGR